jgi:hypothetical protein
MSFPVEACDGESRFTEFLDGVTFTRSDYVVAGLLLLQHEPHGFDIIPGEAEISFHIEVSEIKHAIVGSWNYKLSRNRTYIRYNFQTFLTA